MASSADKDKRNDYSVPPGPKWDAYFKADASTPAFLDKAGLAPQHKEGTVPPDLLSKLPPPITDPATESYLRSKGLIK